MKNIICSILLCPFIAFAQVAKDQPKPKLIVGIVVDQMRNDYIYRYWDRFGTGGFKKLVQEGFYFRNAHFNFVPTFTGPGHSSIYTGATPNSHGIIANEWYVKQTNGWTNCVQDDQVSGVGASSKAGQVSPKNQLSTTMTDELELRSNKKAKVYSVALKDRSAILPAGHTADGAYWLDEASGNFISSSWYCSSLPSWLNTFNQQQLPKKYLEKGWNTLYPIASYSNSLADSNRYEQAASQAQAIFPYKYAAQIEKQQWGAIKYTPFGNSLTKDLALACLKNENLGKDEQTDFLCISFSCTDILAHMTGPRSIEVEDTYLNLDKDLSELLEKLETEVGKGNFVVFLTADHGGAEVPNYLTDNKIPAGYIDDKKLKKGLMEYFQTAYGDTALLANLSNEQVFLNENKIAAMKLNLNEVEQQLCKFLTTYAGISEAYPSQTLKYGSFENDDSRRLLQNGFNHRMSGNVAFTYLPGWMDWAEKGTTHGTSYNYDTHVPVIFYGQGIRKGESFDKCTITQIAPTVCELMRVSQPSACTSVPLNGYFK